jgi:hypothetical protein
MSRAEGQELGSSSEKKNRTWAIFSSDTYKLEKESVFPQCSNAPCKSQNEHYSSHNEEEPHWVKATKISDGRDVGQNSL